MPTASGVPLQLLPKEINGVRIIGIDVPGFGVPTHAEAKDVLAGAMLKYARTEAELGPVAALRGGKADKPTVTLKSDLAFDKNSAALSNAAKVEIAKLARQVKRARLHGTITVNGYTDNLGSASYGLELSKQRAQAVAKYLRSRLNGYRINIVAVGYGEAHPIASNKTEAGRKQNRRVTITLPKN